MKIYKSEKSIESLILDNRSISYLSHVSQISELPNFDDEKFKQSLGSTNTDTPDTIDLFYTQSVLVTTNWNANNDIFDPAEVWASRKTPVDKPTNIEHNQDRIIGHITSQWAIDRDGNMIDNDSVVDDLPESFHICVGGVIYKAWTGVEARTQVAEVINKITGGEMYVSMECLFTDFDYGMSNGSDFKIVERNQESAYLTKHLKCYGGEGSFNGYKLGRILRNITFSGKGYVTKPANPDSIIFTKEESETFNFVRAVHEIPEKENNGVYISSYSDNERETNSMSDNSILENQIVELKSQLAKSAEEVKEAKNALAKADVERLNQTIEDLKEEVATSNTSLSDEKDKLEQAQAAQSQFETDMADLKTEKEDLEKTLADIRLEKTAVDRVSKLVSAGVKEEDARAKVDKFTSLDNEQWDEIAKVFISQAQDCATCPDSSNKTEKKNYKLGNAEADAEADAEDTGASDDEDLAEENAEASTLEDADDSDTANASVGAVDGGKDNSVFHELQSALGSMINPEDNDKESK